MLMLALGKFKTLLSQNPEIEQSQHMMTLHLYFFLAEEIAIFAETFFSIMYWHGVLKIDYNTYKVISVMLNILVALADF